MAHIASVVLSAAGRKGRGSVRPPVDPALKRQLERDHPEWRKPRVMPKPIGTVLATMVERLPTESYAHDPWWILRVAPNSSKIAQDALGREGFESYCPTYRVLTQTPLRLIPPKKRHQANLFKTEIRRPRFDGYLFIRRMFGHYDANRLFDLDGCGSIIRTAGSIALVKDFDVELLRLSEADGKWDENQGEAHRGYRISRLPGANKTWVGTSKIIGRLDNSDGITLFVERMGRIARLISQADPV